jgi:uncharacterized CHY-type Zn-finger protein
MRSLYWKDSLFGADLLLRLQRPVLKKKLSEAAGGPRHLYRAWPQKTRHNLQKLDLTLSRKKWRPYEKFTQNATDRPDINLRAVRQQEHNLRSAVIPHLDVCRASIFASPCASEINDFHMGGFLTDQNYVFGFEVAVDDLAPAKQDKRLKEVPRNGLQERQAQSDEFAPLHYLVKIVREEFKHDTKVFAEWECHNELRSVAGRRVRAREQSKDICLALGVEKHSDRRSDYFHCKTHGIRIGNLEDIRESAASQPP